MISHGTADGSAPEDAQPRAASGPSRGVACKGHVTRPVTEGRLLSALSLYGCLWIGKWARHAWPRATLPDAPVLPNSRPPAMIARIARSGRPGMAEMPSRARSAFRSLFRHSSKNASEHRRRPVIGFPPTLPRAYTTDLDACRSQTSAVITSVHCPLIGSSRAAAMCSLELNCNVLHRGERIDLASSSFR